jgi:hypothetical protein
MLQNTKARIHMLHAPGAFGVRWKMRWSISLLFALGASHSKTARLVANVSLDVWRDSREPNILLAFEVVATT